MQTDSKFAIFFLSLICILIGKGLNNWENLTVFINYLMFSARQTGFVACILTI